MITYNAESPKKNVIIINIGREVLIPNEIRVIEIIIIFMEAGKKMIIKLYQNLCFIIVN